MEKINLWNEWQKSCKAYGYPNKFAVEQWRLYQLGIRDVRICDLMVNFMGKWNINSF